MSCPGNGSCFDAFVCDCGCFDDCDCELDNCLCDVEHDINCLYTINPEHKDCDIFCKFKTILECGCVLINCSNDFICNNKMPKYIIDRNEGLCDCCYLNLGAIKKGPVIECFICFETKENIILSCGHYSCFECFEKWSIENEERPCPICRSNN